MGAYKFWLRILEKIKAYNLKNKLSCIKKMQKCIQRQKIKSTKDEYK